MTTGEFIKYCQDNDIHESTKILIPTVEKFWEPAERARCTLAMLHADGTYETVKENQRVWLPSEVVVTLI